MKKLFVYVLISLYLSGCGPTLFTVGVLDVTAGDCYELSSGCTDASADIVRSFSDDRIRYFEQANGGVSSGRNLGLKQMRGDFFCFLDR